MVAPVSRQSIAAIVIPQLRSVGAIDVRWPLHLAFWGCILALLWCVNSLTGIERVLCSDWPRLNRVWLPLLGLSLYALSWLCFGLWNTLTQESSVENDAALDATWAEAVIAMRALNLDIGTIPCYLILGPDAYECSRIPSVCGATPLRKRSDARFLFYACRDSLFIAPGAGENSIEHLTYQCGLLRNARASAPCQGIVVNVPADASRNEAKTRAFLDRIRTELRVVKESTGRDVPVYLVFHGLTQLSECPTALAKSLPGWRLPFPPFPDLDPAEINAMFKSNVDDLFLNEISASVRNHMTIDGRDNSRCYRWLHGTLTGRHRVAKILMESTWNEYSEPAMIAGCYLVPSEKSAFATIAQQLHADLQSTRHLAVWTASAVAERTSSRRRVAWICGICALGMIGSLGISSILWALRS